MVYGKLLGLFTTILAGMLVTVKNLKAGEFSLGAGTFDHIVQLDYRGHRKGFAGGVDKTDAVLQHLGFVLLEEHHGAPDSTDTEWLVGLVQHQDRKVYHQ